MRKLFILFKNNYFLFCLNPIEKSGQLFTMQLTLVSWIIPFEGMMPLSYISKVKPLEV